jgi:hypothetical protein
VSGRQPAPPVTTPFNRCHQLQHQINAISSHDHVSDLEQQNRANQPVPKHRKFFIIAIDELNLGVIKKVHVD